MGTALEAQKILGILGGIFDGEKALEEAREAEAGGTITSVSYAYLEYKVDNITRVIVVRTGNRSFLGNRDEVRRGTLGSWTMIWERCDIGIVTGEDFLPEKTRNFLLALERVG